MTLDDIIQNAFRKVKDDFGYVPIQKVVSDDKIPTAAIDMKTFKIMVGTKFVESLKEKGMKEEDSVEALLDHEVGHFLFHPYCLERVIREGQAMKGRENGETARQFYDDINNNLRIIASKNATKIPEVYKAMKPESNVEKAILLFYQNQTGLDFGMQNPEENIKNAAESMAKIRFLNMNEGVPEFVKSSDSQNIRDLNRFYSIIKPLMDQDKKEGKGSNPTFSNAPTMKDYSEDQIRDAVRGMIEAGELKPQEAKEILEEVKDKMKSKNRPGGSSNDNPESFADRFIYESLASGYDVKIKGIPLETKRGIYPAGYSEFEAGDEILSMDPFSSNGKILPGITKKIVKKPIKYHGNSEATPDLVLLLDDSGSMPNPKECISNAVLGSYAVAREYLANKSEVAVGRFSDRTVMQGFSDDKDIVLNELLRFKSGDATRVDLGKMSKTNREKADYILITDDQISNRDEVLQYLNDKAQKGSRAYLIRIGMNDTEETREEAYPLVKIFNVQGKEYLHGADLGKIILDDVHSGKGGIK